MFPECAPSGEALFAVNHVQVVQCEDAMFGSDRWFEADVLMELMPYIKAQVLPMQVLLAVASWEIGHAASKHAMPFCRQVKMNLDLMVLFPPLRLAGNVDAELSGKFA